MNRDEKKLKKHFAAHALGFAVRKQRQKETRLRKAMAPTPAARERYTPAMAEEWDEMDLPLRQAFRRPMLRADSRPSAGPTEARAENGAADAVLRRVAGVVLGLAGGRLRVWCEGREGLAVLPGARRISPPAPGDEVTLEAFPHELRVVAFGERRSQLVRPDPHVGARPRVLAANVDTVVIVVPAGPQAPRRGLVDRLLLAVGRTASSALVCVSKIDLLSPPALQEVLERLGEPAAPLVACSAATGAGLDRLAERLRRGRSVLVGHSGAGKTSLLNALVPGCSLATAAVREDDAKGRHTTSAAVLVELPGGGQVLDTPGIREFGLWALGRADLLEYYPEIGRLGKECRYRDCRHRGEPDCRVRMAAQAGELPAARYRSYLRLLDECEP